MSAKKLSSGEIIENCTRSVAGLKKEITIVLYKKSKLKYRLIVIKIFISLVLLFQINDASRGKVKK